MIVKRWMVLVSIFIILVQAAYDHDGHNPASSSNTMSVAPPASLPHASVSIGSDGGVFAKIRLTFCTAGCGFMGRE